MSQRFLIGLTVICVTVLLFTFLVRRSLCELHIEYDGISVAAILAYEAVRE
ncbi:Hok/Gef family protein [Nissabacter sp. SGAir0207]|uniref:Hok/Gef family protein n=1 Tax=Nissabacter sp. SGAir0207 TaxID=2126321 RepID=UPI0010CCFEDE|nr:Hok/Gef family protein [Nissabacter sp. SGAir0207]QCR34651.1 small toxic polypeptide [Nissabacter sp. SGAir0207]